MLKLKLTAYEQEMLDGKYGPVKQKALENICKYAIALNVDELCEISFSTMYVGAHKYLESCGIEGAVENFSAMNAMSARGGEPLVLDSFCKGCICHTCVEPFDPDKTEHLHIPRSAWEKNEAYVKYCTDAGAIRTASCAPYLNGWIPLRGQHFVTTESSNVLLCNSLFGACGNPDGIEASFWASLCGRIPKYGKHDPKNRLGTCLVVIDTPVQTKEEWDVLGYIIGKKAPKSSVPVLTGPELKTDLYKFKEFAAACAVVSDIDMVHIVGLTPEAATQDMAFGGKLPQSELHITREDFRWARGQLCCGAPGAVNYVTLGCPHESIYEIQQIAQYLRGKKVAPQVTLHIWTNYAMRELAKLNGFEQIIREAGAELMAGHCPYGIFEFDHVRDSLLPKNGGLAGDSAKIVVDLPAMCDPSIRTYYGDTWRCIDAAINGVWR